MGRKADKAKKASKRARRQRHKRNAQLRGFIRRQLAEEATHTRTWIESQRRHVVNEILGDVNQRIEAGTDVHRAVRRAVQDHLYPPEPTPEYWDGYEVRNVSHSGASRWRSVTASDNRVSFDIDYDYLERAVWERSQTYTGRMRAKTASFGMMY